MNLLQKLLSRLRHRKRTIFVEPAPSLPSRGMNPEARAELLRDILRYAEVALAYSEFCTACQQRAAQVRRWNNELKAELEAISAERLMSIRRTRKSAEERKTNKCPQ
jgi:hypothetical protein